MTELGSHHIDIANWVFDAIPERATGMTSIVRYHDGRTVGDNVQAVFPLSGRPQVDVQFSDGQCKDGQRAMDLRYGGQRCHHD